MSLTTPDSAPRDYTPQHPIRYLLAALIALGPFTMSLYTPSMPAIALALATSDALVQTSIAIFLVAVAAGQLVYGPLSDRYGRRPILFMGYALFILASIICALAQTIDQLLMARFLQGLGASSGAVMSRAIIRDLFEKADIAKMLSFVSMALAIAPAIGPLLGGQLQDHFGWQSNFIILALSGLVLLVVVAISMPETNRDIVVPSGDTAVKGPGYFLRAYGSVLSTRQFLGYAAPVAGALAGIFSFHSVGPFVLIDQLGVAPTAYGWFTLMSVSGYFFGAFISNRLAGRVPGDRMIVTGLGIAGLAALGMVILGWLAMAGTVTLTPLGFMPPMIGWALSAGLIMPNGATGALQPFPRIAGTASALLGSLQIGAGAAMSAVIGLIGGFLPLTFGLVMVGLVLVSIAVYLWGVVVNPACHNFMRALEPCDDTSVSTIE
ncbi:MAG: multidrug effflux MFS transporter [Pseudomonadota bacterium]